MTADQRPDPDALLGRLATEDGRPGRWRLKVFLGYAAGVGKTYAMLEEARRRRDDGEDVLVALVETHGRAETESLLEGLAVQPRRTVEHRGVLLGELDLEGVLARRPRVALVDELAHSNAPGSRHLKRWQDVQELLAAGTDVCTTLNVQHLESLNDVLAQITGVTVRETLPDQVLDQADDIAVVDIPPPELLRRLAEGKVYVPEQAARAVQRFFQAGNLIALRELTLRRAASRVDEEMRAYMASRAIDGPWAATERLLVCVSGSPYSERLIRAARRLADELRAEWHALYVETPETDPQARENREHVWRDMRLAESLGAHVATVTAPEATGSILEYARKHNVTKMVVGRPARPNWLDRLRGTFVDRLIRRCRPIDVVVVSLAPGPGEKPAARPASPARPAWARMAAALGLVAAATLICAPVHLFIAPENLVMVYLLAVVVAALRLGLGPALLAAFLGVVAFDFFFVPPALTLAVEDTQYLITFAGLFTVGAVVGSLVNRARSQAEAVRFREVRTESLYALSRELVASASVEAVAEAAVRQVGEVLGGEVALWLPEEPGPGWFTGKAGRRPDEKETAVAQWAMQHGRSAGYGTETLSGAGMLHVPLRGTEGVLGVMALQPGAPSALAAPRDRDLVEAYANQVSLALERLRLARGVQQARVLAEAEKLHRAIMDSLSHDLRTPLVTITGAVSSLREEGENLPAAARKDLLEEAWEEAGRLNRLLGNLFDMSRLEAGILRPRLEPGDALDLVGVSLSALAGRIGEREIRVEPRGDLPLVPMDFALMTHVVANLLDNALKFSPPGKPVLVSLGVLGERFVLAVEDEGPGIPAGQREKVFEKFFRLHRADEVAGSGLGLAICKGIVEAHGGAIRAEGGPAGGARLVVELPLGKFS